MPIITRSQIDSAKAMIAEGSEPGDVDFESFMIALDYELYNDCIIGLFTKREAIHRFLDKYDFNRQ